MRSDGSSRYISSVLADIGPLQLRSGTSRSSRGLAASSSAWRRCIAFAPASQSRNSDSANRSGTANPPLSASARSRPPTTGRSGGEDALKLLPGRREHRNIGRRIACGRRHGRAVLDHVDEPAKGLSLLRLEMPGVVSELSDALPASELHFCENHCLPRHLQKKVGPALRRRPVLSRDLPRRRPVDGRVKRLEPQGDDPRCRTTSNLGRKPARSPIPRPRRSRRSKMPITGHASRRWSRHDSNCTGSSAPTSSLATSHRLRLVVPRRPGYPDACHWRVRPHRTILTPVSPEKLPPPPRASTSAVRVVMQGNRRRDTKAELRLRSALHRLGLRFRVDRQIGSGRGAPRPDIAFVRPLLAVFVDGCFWHACPEHGTQPRSNTSYWTAKIARNRVRDAANTQALEALGWGVVRVWEHEDPEVAARAIHELLISRQRERAGRSSGAALRP